MHTQNDWKAFPGFALRVIIAHMLTYFVFGIIMSNVFDYGEIFKREIIRDYMLPMDEHNVLLGPFLQPIRGLIFAIGLWPIRGLLIEKKRGWLILWGLLVTIGILSTPAASPGSIEGMLYSKIPMWYHLMGYPEITLQTLAFSIWLVWWERQSATGHEAGILPRRDHRCQHPFELQEAGNPGKKVSMKWILSLSVILFLLASCATPATQPTETPQAHLPNPASVYCEEQGNKLEIRTAPDGSQSGVCIFPDGSECDEWAFFRNECGPVPEFTEPPASATSAYTPALVTPDSSRYEGWVEYTDSHYRFKFRYPPEWTAELDLRNDSTTYQHLLWLRAPSKPVEGVQMNIAFERINENYGLQRTGIGAGELIERGQVLFLGEPARRIVLSLEGRDMEIMYGDTGAFERGTMRFVISLNYVGAERLGLTTELEQVADLIVASFELEK